MNIETFKFDNGFRDFLTIISKIFDNRIKVLEKSNQSFLDNRMECFLQTNRRLTGNLIKFFRHLISNFPIMDSELFDNRIKYFPQSIELEFFLHRIRIFSKF